MPVGRQMLHCCIIDFYLPISPSPGFLSSAFCLFPGLELPQHDFIADRWHGSHCTLFFFFLSEGEKSKCIIYKHFLGGHTSHLPFSLFSGLTQLPSVLLSTPGCPVLDNALQRWRVRRKLAMIECWNSLSIYIVSDFLCFLGTNQFVHVLFHFFLLSLTYKS